MRKGRRKKEKQRVRKGIDVNRKRKRRKGCEGKMEKTQRKKRGIEKSRKSSLQHDYASNV